MNCIKVSWDLNETAMLFFVTGKGDLRNMLLLKDININFHPRLLFIVVNIILKFLNELKLSREQLILTYLFTLSFYHNDLISLHQYIHS